MSPRAHVLFTNGRSGSNYVSNLLNAHPRVVNYGEVRRGFNPAFRLHVRWNMWGRNTEAHLDSVLESRSYFELAQGYSAIQHVRRGERPNYKRWAATASVGFKEFGIGFERHGLDTYLSDRPHISVISLVRENTFDRVVSIHRLAQTQQVASKGANVMGADQPIAIPVEDVLRDLTVFEEEKRYQQKLVAGLDLSRVLHVTYEELFRSDESQTAFRAELFAMLGVNDVDVSSSHRRLSELPTDKRLSNYPEIREAVQATDFARYLP